MVTYILSCWNVLDKEHELCGAYIYNVLQALKYVGMVVIWPLASGKPSNSFQNKIVETGAVYRQSCMYGDNA